MTQVPQESKGQFVRFPSHPKIEVAYYCGIPELSVLVDPNEPHDIYKLTDPRDGAVRYVGISVDATKRYKQHVKDKGCNPRKIAWLQELQKVGLQPALEIIENVPGKKLAKERERYWIDFYSEQGHALTNVQSAGEVGVRP